jgi:hypothetical protein
MVAFYAGSDLLSLLRPHYARAAYQPDPATPSHRGPPDLPNSAPKNPPSLLSTAIGSPVDRSEHPHRNGLERQSS